ncbi:hypothetical protein J4E85_007908 [Alternaria conjuncta]|uniref:uncharacterized protein n=1 Tax=Alternaria conjuncta TaxID=181017 RepID=UPI00221EE1F8|nr:uncharacterized protein J4E85_007908 [Alternaria conjuncta]KAI4924791.1 hypothetical protein J4E85_007908 [Alternaria conjuncta]
MAPPLNSQDDRAAFVDACINKRKKAMHAWESLGLISEKLHDEQHGYFVNKEKADKANELQRVVEGIAKSFATSYRGTIEELHTYLAEENAFSEDVLRLGQEFGVMIWGRIEDGEIRSSGESQGNGIEEQDWDDPKDRQNILFYIRCWLICTVVREYKATPRKAKAKARTRDLSPSQDNPNEDTVEDLAEGDSPRIMGVSFRAPEPPRMYPTPEPRRDTTFTSANEKTTSTSFTSVNKTTTPSKRKAQYSHERTPSGKLSKPSKGGRTIPVLTNQSRDPYSIPISPPAFSPISPPAFPNLGRASFQRRRETTYDSDATWMPPREETADAETVVDAEDVHPGEVDSRIQKDIATSNADDMQYEYDNDINNAAGPSGTYRNPLRQDSVIPDTQTQNDAVDAIIYPPSGQIIQIDEDISSDAYTDAIIRSLISDPSPTTRQTRIYRLELYRLLVAYLNGIKNFDPTNYDSAAEERMDFLLNQFHCTDADAWQSDHNDSALRLHLAFEKWMSMRHRLAAFRSVTGYFGAPRRQWEEHLRGLDDVPHAEAILAFVDLKDAGDGEESGRVLGDGFDNDLMMMFDGLTKFQDCNGPEAFKGVRKFNERLLVWFRDE